MNRDFIFQKSVDDGTVARLAIHLNPEKGEAVYDVDVPWWEQWGDDKKVKVRQIECPCQKDDYFGEKLRNAAELCPLCNNLKYCPDMGTLKRLITSINAKRTLIKMADYHFVEAEINDPSWMEGMYRTSVGKKAYGLAVFSETHDRTYSGSEQTRPIRVKASPRAPAVLVVGIPSIEHIAEWEQGKQGVFAVVTIPGGKVKRTHVDQAMRQTNEFIKSLKDAIEIQNNDLDQIEEMIMETQHFMRSYDRIERGLDPETGVPFGVDDEKHEPVRVEKKLCSSRTRGVPCKHDAKVWDAKGKGWCKTHAHRRGLLKG